jgi:hypothetical protein
VKDGAIKRIVSLCARKPIKSLLACCEFELHSIEKKWRREKTRGLTPNKRCKNKSRREKKERNNRIEVL